MPESAGGTPTLPEKYLPNGREGFRDLDAIQTWKMFHPGLYIVHARG